jgi:hypothetical protein
VAGAYTHALVAGDVKAAKAHAVGDAAGLQRLEDLMKMASSDAKWQAALKAKFGETGPMSISGAMVAGAERATEQVSGDTAMVTAPGAARGIQFLRQKDGTWKVNASYDPTGRAAAAAAELRISARVKGEMAAAVAAGKYPTLSKALRAHDHAEAEAWIAAEAETPDVPPAPGADEGDGLD